MKRSSALTAFSREHHATLVLTKCARRIDEGSATRLTPICSTVGWRRDIVRSCDE